MANIRLGLRRHAFTKSPHLNFVASRISKSLRNKPVKIALGDNMRPEIGFLGVLAFTLGGAILFTQYYLMQRTTSQVPAMGVFMGGIAGFILVGIGLWIIVQSGRADIDQTSTSNLHIS